MPWLSLTIPRQYFKNLPENCPEKYVCPRWDLNQGGQYWMYRFYKLIMSVLWLESGFTVKYSPSPWKSLAEAEAKFDPPLVIIQIQCVFLACYIPAIQNPSSIKEHPRCKGLEWNINRTHNLMSVHLNG